MTVSLGTNAYGNNEGDCCYCLSTGNLKKIWEAEKDSCSNGNCIGGCGYGLLSRVTWLTRGTICIPYNIICCGLCNVTGATTLALSIIPAVGGLLGAIATCGCCCGEADCGCGALIATEACAGVSAVAGLSCMCGGNLAGIAAIIETLCFPFHCVAPEATQLCENEVYAMTTRGIGYFQEKANIFKRNQQ